MSPTQRAKLGLDSTSSAYTSEVPGLTGPACGVIGVGSRAVSVIMRLSMDNSITVFTGPEATGEISPITVAGFPAILARPEKPHICSVDIDVAEGQFLDIHFRDDGPEPAPSQDQLCRDAAQVANEVMQTLQAS